MIPALGWEPTASGGMRAPPPRATLVGAFGSARNDLRRATAAPPTPIGVGGAPDVSGGKWPG